MSMPRPMDIDVHAVLPSQKLLPALHRTGAAHMQWLRVSTG
jgi:hypothetical protein